MAKIAIVGTGISGLGAAYLLNQDHDITVYEKAPRIGGHSRTVTVNYDGASIPVDTGFIVYNQKNYPHLTGMFACLNVPSHKSDMTFAASIADGWLEWGAKDLSSVLGQYRNVLRPNFWRLARDVLKFNAQCEETVDRHPNMTLTELMDHLNLGAWFRHYYLLPMSGAIWSCPPTEMMSFPAHTLVKFFANHHLLSNSGQPQWWTVTGGSQEYVRRLTASFSDRIRAHCGAQAITRQDGKVQIRDTLGASETYDHVVLACHGNEALALLKDADRAETSALSCFRFQKNVAVLHKDASVMPRRKRCWASWNYVSDGNWRQPAITVTYWMNLLQAIDTRHPLFVSLNPKRAIDERVVFDTAEFDHPVFDQAALDAQPRIAAMQGARGIWFAGAWLRHGFHEDGLASAVDVARRLGSAVPWSVPEVPPLRAAEGVKGRSAPDFAPGLAPEAEPELA